MRVCVFVFLFVVLQTFIIPGESSILPQLCSSDSNTSSSSSIFYYILPKITAKKAKRLYQQIRPSPEINIIRFLSYTYAYTY
jgi:hypothetical protein